MTIYFIIYLLNIFDYVCTTYFINLYGVSVEANPIMRCVYHNAWVALAVKFVGVAAVLYFMYKHGENKCAQIGAWVLLVAFALLALYHIFLFITAARM